MRGAIIASLVFPLLLAGCAPFRAPEFDTEGVSADEVLLGFGYLRSGTTIEVEGSFRDGAFVAMTWDSLGDRKAARNFYDFCSRALTDEGFLHQRYGPDGSVGSSWHPDPVPGSRLRPIQEDSTALVCLAASKHILAAPDETASRELAESLVFPAAGFLISYRDEKSGLEQHQ